MDVFETPGSVSLRIKLQSGRAIVTTADVARTSVELVAAGRKGQDALDDLLVTCDERDGSHVVRVEQRDKIRWGPLQISWGGGFEVRVTCPHGTGLEFSGGSTDLRATGELGDVSARTASGDIALEVVRGRLEVKTASGEVSVSAIASEASVVTVSGDLEIGRIEGTLTARAVSGDARIRSLSGDLALTTTSGDVEIGAIEEGELRVQTVSGDVRVGVARGTRVWVDAASVSGDLASELGLGDEEPSMESGAVVPLQVKTVSGDVSIVRAAALAT